MKYRSPGMSQIIIATFAFLWLTSPAFAQYGPPSAAEIAAMKAAAAKPTPHMPDGHPDLTGIWFSPTTARITGPGVLKKEGNSIVINQTNPGTQVAKPLDPANPGTPPYKAGLLSKVFELNQKQSQVDPGWGCKPPGIPRLGSPHQIVQTPGQVVF